LSFPFIICFISKTWTWLHYTQSIEYSGELAYIVHLNSDDCTLYSCRYLLPYVALNIWYCYACCWLIFPYLSIQLPWFLVLLEDRDSLKKTYRTVWTFIIILAHSFWIELEFSIISSTKGIIFFLLKKEIRSIETHEPNKVGRVTPCNNTVAPLGIWIEGFQNSEIWDKNFDT